MSARPSPLDLALLVVLAFIWGSSFTVIKVIVEDIPPLSLTATRIAVAAVVLAVAARVLRQAWPRGRGVWAWIVAAGLTGNILPFTLISWGEERIDSGLAAIYIAIVPIATLVLAHYFTRDERFTWRKLIGVVMGFSGILVLIGPQALLHLDEYVVRQLAVALAAVSYAVNTLIVKRLSGVRPVAMAAAIMTVSAVILAPVALWHDGLVRPPASSTAWAVTLGVIHTAAATLIMFFVVRRAGASFFSMINFLIPVIGYFLGVILLGEALSPRAIAALALILAGIYVSAGRAPGGAGKGH